MVKNWEDMSNRERAEQTIKDIQARQEKREHDRLEGIKQADSFMFRQKEKALKKKRHIRCKSYK